MKSNAPIPRTIRELRAEVRALRAETQQLRRKGEMLVETMELRDCVLQLEKASRDLIPLMRDLPLTKSKRRLLGILHRGAPEIVPRERIRVLMWGVDSAKDPKGLDVHICQLRRLVRRHSITIETAVDVGYRLPAESQARVTALIDQHARVAAAAIRPINGVTLGASHALDA